MKKIATISAPAKAILCGEHAVVYGEDAIAFGVDLKCYCNLWLQQTENDKPNTIQFKIQMGNQQKNVQFNQLLLLKAHSLNQIKGKQIIGQHSFNEVDIPFYSFCQFLTPQVQTDKILTTTLYKVALFCGIYGINSQKFKNLLNNRAFLVQTSSQIPIGKGLGSSASFNSVLASTLMVIFNIFKPNDNLHTFKQIINYFSKIFERVEHGQPSGIDNFVSIYGGMVLFNRSKNPPFNLIDNQKILNYLSQNLSIAFVDSGVQKNTKLAVSNVRQKYNLHLEGNNEYKHMITQIGAFPNQIISILSAQNFNDQQRKTELFIILNKNHQYLRSLGLSNKEIQEIVSRYDVEGKSVAKITGAGMGGVVLIVGEKQFLQQMKSKEIQSFFLSKMNTNGLSITFQN